MFVILANLWLKMLYEIRLWRNWKNLSFAKQTYFVRGWQEKQVDSRVFRCHFNNISVVFNKPFKDGNKVSHDFPLQCKVRVHHHLRNKIKISITRISSSVLNVAGSFLQLFHAYHACPWLSQTNRMFKPEIIPFLKTVQQQFPKHEKWEWWIKFKSSPREWVDANCSTFQWTPPPASTPPFYSILGTGGAWPAHVQWPEDSMKEM